jgi:hypothetical protein
VLQSKPSRLVRFQPYRFTRRSLRRIGKMDETIPPPSLASLPPPPPASAGAPGQMSYDSAPGSNGQANPHMPPPPLPPVVIPQNNNPIPTAINSPSSGDILSPTSSGGYVRRAAPEPNKRALYVGGLDPRVTEEVLRQIFETTGHVQSVKIIPDKTVSSIKPTKMDPRARRFHHYLHSYGCKSMFSAGAFELRLYRFLYFAKLLLRQPCS